MEKESSSESFGQGTNSQA